MKKLTLLMMGGAAVGSVFAQNERPNILIIQCDQLGKRVVGTYGEKQGITNIIDSIADKGVVFANTYVGCPLSQPSRAALWTGMMPHETNVRSNSHEPVNTPIGEDAVTLGKLFSSNGYTAVHFGKTHDMGALNGFDHKEPVPIPFEDPYFPVNQDSFKDAGTCKDVVEFLSTPPQNPFICIADFQNPHNICGYIGEFEGVHENPPFACTLPELPANFEVNSWKELPLPIQYICCSHRRMTQAAHWSQENYRHYIAAYEHYTRMVCTQIEQVIAALKSTPQGKNTIVVVMADHGDAMASHRMVTKQISFYEEVTNVPFIVAGRQIERRHHHQTPLVQITTDLLPTLCELAGVPVPAEKRGVSWAPLLQGRIQEKFHDYVASEWHSEFEYIVTPGRMIRSDRYKYTHYLEGGEELYDMHEDAGEMHNMALNPEYRDVLDRHRALLDDYIVRTNDDYWSLLVKADPRCREHQPGYPAHTEGSDIRTVMGISLKPQNK